MKVAILTLPLGHNYGGILQAYALSTILKESGHDVSILDRRAKPIPYHRQAKQALRSIREKLRLWTNPPSAPPSCLLSQDFENLKRFIRMHLPLTEELKSSHTLRRHYRSKQYEFLLIGSDQVWRPRYAPNLLENFGSFLDSTDARGSYAASFGVSHWELSSGETQLCRELLKRFGGISVRESSGIDLCKQHFRIDAEHHVDPTLLLTNRKYSQLLTGEYSRFTDAVANYILDETPFTRFISSRVARYLGKREESFFPWMAPAAGDLLRTRVHPHVEDWLMLFRDASFIITDSFHGCVFSIIFNKPFLALGNIRRGLARFKSLLAQLDLENHLILGHELELSHALADVKWDKVNEIISQERERSIEYLSKILAGA